MEPALLRELRARVAPRAVTTELDDRLARRRIPGAAQTFAEIAEVAPRGIDRQTALGGPTVRRADAWPVACTTVEREPLAASGVAASFIRECASRCHVGALRTVGSHHVAARFAGLFRAVRGRCRALELGQIAEVWPFGARAPVLRGSAQRRETSSSAGRHGQRCGSQRREVKSTARAVARLVAARREQLAILVHERSPSGRHVRVVHAARARHDRDERRRDDDGAGRAHATRRASSVADTGTCARGPRRATPRRSNGSFASSDDASIRARRARSTSRGTL